MTEYFTGYRLHGGGYGYLPRAAPGPLRGSRPTERRACPVIPPTGAGVLCGSEPTDAGRASRRPAYTRRACPVIPPTGTGVLRGSEPTDAGRASRRPAYTR